MKRTKLLGICCVQMEIIKKNHSSCCMIVVRTWCAHVMLFTSWIFTVLSNHFNANAQEFEKSLTHNVNPNCLCLFFLSFDHITITTIFINEYFNNRCAYIHSFLWPNVLPNCFLETQCDPHGEFAGTIKRTDFSLNLLYI